MTGIEQWTGRTAAKAGGKLVGAAHRAIKKKQTRRDSRALAARRVAEKFVEALPGSKAERLARYLESPDFEEVALQLTLWRLLRDEKAAEVEPTVREEIRLGLKHAVGLDSEQLTIGADLVFDSLLVAVQRESYGLKPSDVDKVTAAGVAHLAAATAANTSLLERVESLAAFHRFGTLLRRQVAGEHALIRMPHLGVHRSVAYSDLYVQPSLEGLSDLDSPGRRSVVLGDPGAGKSTLAAKLAHDIATGDDGRVPFLLVLRNFTTSFRAGGQGLVWYLEKACQEPYNVTPPEHAVEYLLRNGRAVVILDGVDELLEPELRGRFARLVESFARLHPLVPLVVTARKIGYADAELDRDLFTTGAIKQFGEDQVRRYAENWFALSEAVPERQRPALAEAFLRESEAVEELRLNPLLLALLCNMYAYERYIPGNLAQVYEKCALMLFEQWDHRRGMRELPRFTGRLRSAVGYLAWKQHTAASSGVGWPRRKVILMLGEFLEGKGYQRDEAREEAERFLEFCAGRPWVLTDIGGGAAEPRYGFTHRTFMEYFTAEHLARKSSTAGALWSALTSTGGPWGIVSQISLQLFDEQHDDGASEVLGLIAKSGDEDHVMFALDSLSYLTPTPTAVRSVVDAAVDAIAVKPLESLYFHLHSKGRITVEAPLEDAINDCLPTNRPILLATMEKRLRELASRGSLTANVLLARLEFDATDNYDPVPLITFEITGDVIHDLDEAVRRIGPKVAYLHDENEALILLPATDWQRVDPMTFIRSETPWIDAEQWWPRGSRELLLPFPHPTTDTELLLQLPILETYEKYAEGFGPEDALPLIFDLVNGRRDEGPRQQAVMALSNMGVREEVRDFLDRWMRREFDVIG